MPEGNAIEFVQEYIGQMYQADLYYRENRKGIARERSVTAEEDHRIFSEALGMARETHKSFWDTTENEWYPNSLGWPSEYKLSTYSNWRILATKESLLVCVDGPSLVSSCQHLYYLKKNGNSFKIVGFMQK